MSNCNIKANKTSLLGTTCSTKKVIEYSHIIVEKKTFSKRGNPYFLPLLSCGTYVWFKENAGFEITDFADSRWVKV